MRSLWNGEIRVGVLSVKVKLFPAWRKRLRFKMLCKAHLKPVRMKKFCEEGEELSKEDIIRGVKFRGELIPVENEIIEFLKPTATKTIEIRKRHEGLPSPVYVKESFIVVPDNSERQLEALKMALAGQHLEGTIIYRGRVEPIAIYVENNSVVASILHYEEEREAYSWSGEAKEEDVEIMKEVLERLEVGRESEEHDPLYERIKKYLEAKEKA